MISISLQSNVKTFKSLVAAIKKNARFNIQNSEFFQYLLYVCVS